MALKIVFYTRVNDENSQIFSDIFQLVMTKSEWTTNILPHFCESSHESENWCPKIGCDIDLDMQYIYGNDWGIKQRLIQLFPNEENEISKNEISLVHSTHINILFNAIGVFLLNNEVIASNQQDLLKKQEISTKWIGLKDTIWIHAHLSRIHVPLQNEIDDVFCFDPTYNTAAGNCPGCASYKN